MEQFPIETKNKRPRRGSSINTLQKEDLTSPIYHYQKSKDSRKEAALLHTLNEIDQTDKEFLPTICTTIPEKLSLGNILRTLLFSIAIVIGGGQEATLSEFYLHLSLRLITLLGNQTDILFDFKKKIPDLNKGIFSYLSRENLLLVSLDYLIDFRDYFFLREDDNQVIHITSLAKTFYEGLIKNKAAIPKFINVQVIAGIILTETKIDEKIKWMNILVEGSEEHNLPLNWMYCVPDHTISMVAFLAIWRHPSSGQFGVSESYCQKFDEYLNLFKIIRTEKPGDEEAAALFYLSGVLLKLRSSSRGKVSDDMTKAKEFISRLTWNDRSNFLKKVLFSLQELLKEN